MRVRVLLLALALTVSAADARAAERVTVAVGSQGTMDDARLEIAHALGYFASGTIAATAYRDAVRLPADLSRRRCRDLPEDLGRRADVAVRRCGGPPRQPLRRPGAGRGAAGPGRERTMDHRARIAFATCDATVDRLEPVKARFASVAVVLEGPDTPAFVVSRPASAALRKLLEY